MSKEHLINLKDRTLKERQEIGRKGGLVKSPKKTRAAQLRGLKHIKDPTKKQQKLLELITNPQTFDYEMALLYEDILNDPEIEHKDKVNLLKTLTSVKTSIHGVVTKNLNVNINYSDVIKEREEKWKTIMKERFSKKQPQEKERS